MHIMRQEIIDARRRIQQAMDMTGLNASSLAREAGFAESTLTRLMGASPQSAPTYRTLLMVSQAVERLTGKKMPDAEVVSSGGMADPKKSHLDGTHGLIAIPELDVRAAAGDGVLVDEMGEQERQWLIPLIDLLAISNNPRSLRIITVEGDSMEPDYRPGEKIVIDTSLRNFTHDGVYVLDFGFGLVVKHLQLVLDSDPKKLLVVSANPIYRPQEITLDRAEIKGKVAAKWQRR